MADATTPRSVTPATTPRGTTPRGTRRKGASRNGTPRRRSASNASQLREKAPIDEEELRKVFQHIDLDKSGGLDLGELEQAARELGIKCSVNSMKKVFKMIDADGSGVIEWEEFKEFFGKVSDPDEIKAMLSAHSQRFFDYKARVAADPTFGRDFPMPASLNVTQTYKGHSATVESVVWVDDDHFASVSSEGLVCLWDVSAGPPLGASPRAGPPPEAKSTLPVTPVYCMDALPNNRGVLVGLGAKSENVWLWDPKKSERVRVYDGHTSAVYSISVNDRSAVSGGKTGQVCLNDVERSRCVSTWCAHEDVVYSCAIGRNERLFCTASRDGNVKVIDSRVSSYPECVQAVIEDASAGYPVCKAIWSGDNEIATGGDDYCVKRWDIRAPRNPPVASHLGHTSSVKALALSGDGQFLVSGGGDGSIRLWVTDPDASRRRQKQPAIDESQGLLDAAREKLKELGEDADPFELRDAAAEVERLQQRHAELEGRHRREDMDCLKASMDLGNHRMALCSLAWRDTASGKCRLVSGAQDEDCCLFDIDPQRVLAGL
eukprot:TRINITY_DN27363_c0_g1_i2.p1 TRINITY_DN27363_c0_g1~~TRINITY_DN27363_c0_g1_i2.p1  ORF type:complete len:547 (+),score=119.85 TRINITY_DN27363_c0_g1_i2:87-1727(+)